MADFQFHGELFDLRAMVMEALSENDFVWLSDFGSVDLAHDIYGIEVTGVPDESRADDMHSPGRTAAGVALPSSVLLSSKPR